MGLYQNFARPYTRDLQCLCVGFVKFRGGFIIGGSTRVLYEIFNLGLIEVLYRGARGA